MTEEEYRRQWVEAQYEVMGWWIDKQIEHAAFHMAVRNVWRPKMGELMKEEGK